MFELRLVQGSVLKKVIDSIKDLITNANFDCSSTGFSLQAMDSSHVALVALLLRSEGFEHYRCDRNISMGINVANMAKLLKCASSDDIITVKADDGTDTVTFVFESPNQDKVSDIEMKLMDIDSERLGIPEAEFDAIVRMPSTEFASMCHNLSTIGDTVTISVSKQGVTFSTKGDIGSGNITCRHNTSVEKPEDATIIEMQQPVILTFSLKYINTFTKATSLSAQVTISMSTDMPMVIEYKIEEMGYVRFYLAPKLEEDEVEPNPEPQVNNRTAGDTQTEKEDKPEDEAKPEGEAEPKFEIKGEMETETGETQNKMETDPEANVQLKVEVDSKMEAKASAERKPGALTKSEGEVMEIE